MVSPSIIDSRQFARLGAFLGWEADETVAALCEGADWALDAPVARQLVDDAIAERQRLDAEEERELDEQALKAEYDLDFGGPCSERLAHTPENEQAVFQAWAAATALRRSSGLGIEELAAFVTGAFRFGPEDAFLIAAAAVEAAL